FTQLLQGSFLKIAPRLVGIGVYALNRQVQHAPGQKNRFSCLFHRYDHSFPLRCRAQNGHETDDHRAPHFSPAAPAAGNRHFFVKKEGSFSTFPLLFLSF
ncbi:MAG: hypothetical protein PUC62_07085, partial [Oscillospiraceae bacterium]|nr:hypothetical protein [Oscillospiraceae bacterium]